MIYGSDCLLLISHRTSLISTLTPSPPTMPSPSNSTPTPPPANRPS
uniref:Uncharacterized protein n=1 Tax=Lotus japonicus TaxID=34305 RepID=I3SWQ8_LOTJA|nr:unknown [Lotus japonicus]